jgi:predicted nucleotidyltransferase
MTTQPGMTTGSPAGTPVIGSALRDDFGPDSDIGFLVEFEPDARIGFIELGNMEQELEALLGRPVDLVPKGGFRPMLREEPARLVCGTTASG